MALVLPMTTLPHNLPTSLELAELSRQAYDSATIKANNTEILITESHGCLVCAFRGTTFDGLDIIRDLRAFPWWASEGRGFAHKGFLVGVRSIMPILKTYPLASNAVVLTGHSKGGAEAILTGAFMTLAGYPPVKIETFGAPRAAFGWIEDVLKGVPGYRWRLGADIVPTVPHRFPFPYRHDRGLTTLATRHPSPFLNHRINDYVRALQQEQTKKDGPIFRGRFSLTPGGVYPQFLSILLRPIRQGTPSRHPRTDTVFEDGGDVLLRCHRIHAKRHRQCIL